MRYVALLLLQLFIVSASGQTRLKGYIRTAANEPISGVTVQLASGAELTKSDSTGFYTVSVHSSSVVLIFKRIGFQSAKLELDLSRQSISSRDVTLYPSVRTLDEVKILDTGNGSVGVVSIDRDLSEVLPAASGNFEAFLKTLPGVSVNNELTAQYSVRGGNFDENLLYINDVELFKPLLVKSGQQEGLSFVNAELASNIKFSAGGFEPRYGDKMSSVLDVRYGRPDSSELVASIGILGSSATLKYLGSKRRSYLLVGVRQKANRSILRSQDLKGDFRPRFNDAQAVYDLHLTDQLSINYFGSFNSSDYDLIPESRDVQFGTARESLRFQVDYFGREQYQYHNLMNTLGLSYSLNNRLSIKMVNSFFSIKEREAIDIQGKFTFNPSSYHTGNGASSDMRHNTRLTVENARNSLTATVLSSELKGIWRTGRSTLESGIRYQYDKIRDNISEYTIVDSTTDSSEDFFVRDAISAKDSLSTSRITGYVQTTINLGSKVIISGGVRGNFNSRTDAFVMSPRLSAVYRPNRSGVSYRVSGGIYAQPVFYQEMRDPSGRLWSDLPAQHSIHLLTGMERNITWLRRNLRLNTEIYYKFLKNLIPYKLENLHIQYLPGQRAKGYAAGVDLSLSGELVKDLESAVRLSWMKSEEDIEGDHYFEKDIPGNTRRVEPGYLKRPNDQRINLSVFFQDQAFRNPSYKVHLNLVYGSAMPVGPSRTERYLDVFRIPAYKRADIGFSKEVVPPHGGAKRFKSLKLYAGVFNLFDQTNTVSYLWIKDVEHNQYAVPNYLSGRLLNIKVIGRIH